MFFDEGDRYTHLGGARENLLDVYGPLRAFYIEER